MSKIDCSITENYLKERSRMIKIRNDGSCGIRCEDCPLSVTNNKMNVFCYGYEMCHPDKTIAIVQKWSDEHPQLTMLDKFKEQHPNAPMNRKGSPVHTCPYHIGYEEQKDKPCKNKNYKCSDCWNRPYEENDDD